MKFFKKLGQLILRALDPEDSLSVKRVALLISLVLFSLITFTIFVVGSILSFINTKGNLETMKLYAGQNALTIKYCFLIVASLVGAISIDDVGSALVAKAQATLPDITVADGAQSTIVQNAENISPAETVNAQNVETVNTNTTTQAEEVN